MHDGYIRYVRHLEALAQATQFGVLGRNGLNFHRSVHNPNSRLIRTIEYLGKVGFARKETLLREVLAPKQYRRINVSGWGSVFFAKARKAGFLTYEHGLWSVGPTVKNILS